MDSPAQLPLGSENALVSQKKKKKAETLENETMGRYFALTGRKQH